jgi:aspartyl-tRNA(Asn)/glutamyl-tRNA(Gln) amidotransferase subunit A
MNAALHTLSAIELRDLISQGSISAVDAIQYFLERIDRLDVSLGAFLNVFHTRALEKAELIDRQRSQGKPVGKLAGVPIAIKDNIHVLGELTTCASKFLTNYRAPFEATVVELLEQEGAIIIGKTNLDEFAMGSSTEYSALKSTRNPWNLNCSPGGSSGGSAAAVAARLCLGALGSDTGGSIRQPAAFCGVVGFKPTYGRVSRHGLVSLASSLDHIGPIATCSRDAALMMEILGKYCPRDAMSANRPPEDYLNEMSGDIKGLTIGVPWRYFDSLSPASKALMQEAITSLEKLGAQIVEIDFALLDKAVAVYSIIGSAEAAFNFARFDGIKYGVRSAKATTIDEIYSLSKEDGFGPEVKRRLLLGTYILSSCDQNTYYTKAQQIRTLIAKQLEEAFQKCDLIATPVTASTAFESGSIRDPVQMSLEDTYTIPMNLAGLPAISIPAGLINGKPFGIQLTGPQKSDVKVFQAAYAFEKRRKPLLPPQHS